MTIPTDQQHQAASHSADDLITLFNAGFSHTHRTELVGGAEEPFYEVAKNPGEHHVIYFRSDFFASALHELGHWCLAGPARRALDDYGYWYEPVRDSVTAQQRFEAAEVRPQAVQWALSVACDFPFRISRDNLWLPESDPSDFKRAVWSALGEMAETGFNRRTSKLIALLCQHYQTSWRLPELHQCLH